MAENLEGDSATSSTESFASLHVQRGEALQNDFLVNEENLDQVLEDKIKEEIAARSLILSVLSEGSSNVSQPQIQQNVIPHVENLMAMKPHAELSPEQSEQTDLNFDVSEAIQVEMIAIQQEESDTTSSKNELKSYLGVNNPSSETAISSAILEHNHISEGVVNSRLPRSSVILNAIAIKGENGVTEIQFEGTDITEQTVLQSQPQHDEDNESEVLQANLTEGDIGFTTAEIELPSAELVKYPKLFVATTAQEAHEVIKRYAEETMSTFVSMRKMKQFGITEHGIDLQKKNYRVFFESADVEFDGIPYVYVADKMYICHLGKDKTEVTRQKIREQSMARRMKLGLPTKDVSAVRLRTKKIDCPVKITVKMIAKFPQFKVTRKAKRVCETASKKVRKALVETNGKLSCYYAFVGRLPGTDEHNHSVGEENAEHEPIDPLIKDKIIQLTWEGVASSSDVKKLLEEFVEQDLFAGRRTPPRNRRRYYPTVKDIRNYMNKAKMLTRLSSDLKEELQLLALKLQQTRPTENIILQSDLVDGSQEALVQVKSSREEAKTTLIFCHQTSQQQRLLKRYGNTVLVCEVTNLVERVPFPLICLFVQTNVDYQLVASFIVEIRNKESLIQGLNTIKEWNPGWSPKYIIVDYCEEQTEAAKTVFPGSSQFISDESRERSWRNWLIKSEAKIAGDPNHVFQQFEAIANAYNEDVLHQAALQLENSEVWRESASLRSWFNSNWLLEAKRWVVGYRPDDFIVTLHNESTLEQDMKCLKEVHMCFMRGKKLGSLIEKLVDRMIPDFYRRYIELNRKSYTQANELRVLYGDQLPTCLVNKPAAVIMHVLDQIKSTESTVYQVSHVQPGVFWIQDASAGNSNDQAHTVSFGDAATLPSCDCLDWQRFKLPCKHLCSVFSSFPDWGWDMLNSSYTANPLINLDYSCIKPWVDAQEKQDHRLSHLTTTPTFNLRGDDAKTITSRFEHSFDKINSSGGVAISGVELEVPLEDKTNSETHLTKLTQQVTGDVATDEQRNSIAVQCRDLLENLSQLSSQLGSSDQLERLKSDLQASIGMLRSNISSSSYSKAQLQLSENNKRRLDSNSSCLHIDNPKKTKLDHEKSDSSIDESYVSEEEQVGVPIDDATDAEDETLEITTGHQMDELEESTPPQTPETKTAELANEEVPMHTVLTRPRVNEETPEQRERKLLAILTASST